MKRGVLGDKFDYRLAGAVEKSDISLTRLLICSWQFLKGSLGEKTDKGGGSRNKDL